MAAQSKLGDAEGHGRGDTWPTGTAPELDWVRDWGRRVYDRAADTEDAAFDLNRGRAEVVRSFMDSAGSLMTMNGTAATLFSAGTRGPHPTVRVYCKAANAALRNWDIVPKVLRLMDSPNVDASGGPGFELLNSAGEAKVIGWDSVDCGDLYDD